MLWITHRWGFCVMRYMDDFERCIRCAVNHDGEEMRERYLAHQPFNINKNLLL